MIDYMQVGILNLVVNLFEDLLFNDLFFQARPLKTMQKLIENLKSENIFILGAAVTNNNEIEQKYRWLEKYYPNIRKEHIFFKILLH